MFSVWFLKEKKWSWCMVCSCVYRVSLHMCSVVPAYLSLFSNKKWINNAGSSNRGTGNSRALISGLDSTLECVWSALHWSLQQWMSHVRAWVCGKRFLVWHARVHGLQVAPQPVARASGILSPEKCDGTWARFCLRKGSVQVLCLYYLCTRKK